MCFSRYPLYKVFFNKQLQKCKFTTWKRPKNLSGRNIVKIKVYSKRVTKISLNDKNSKLSLYDSPPITRFKVIWRLISDYTFP